jgi:dihydroorotate dehydrogenase
MKQVIVSPYIVACFFDRRIVTVLYKMLRTVLFFLPPETSHRLVLTMLKWWYKCPLFYRHAIRRSPSKPVCLAGLTLGNPVGLAGGFDKNGDYIDALFALGFGFIELGTVTPLPQLGNLKPRLFRLVSHEALINRMGFNNKGVDYLVTKLKEPRMSKGVIGVNVGKNKLTPNDEAAEDYKICIRKVYPYADYVTVNISSPNTPGLRDLQRSDQLSHLLKELSHCRQQLIQRYQRKLPFFLKITVDIVQEELALITQLVRLHGFDGIISTNTTIDRSLVQGDRYANELGGLSGKPLTRSSVVQMQRLTELTQGNLVLIGVGGIFNASDAQAQKKAGASCVQIYSSFIYRGPGVVRKIARGFYD